MPIQVFKIPLFLKVFAMVFVFSLSQISFTQAATTKAAKPATPVIEKIISTKVSSARYNLKVYVSVEKGKGKNKVTQTRVSASGKTCYIPISKKSCTLKNLSAGKSIKINSRSQNRFGFSKVATPITYKVGAKNWVKTTTLKMLPVSPTQGSTNTEPAKLPRVTQVNAVNPFVSIVSLSDIDMRTFEKVKFEISPKPNTYAAPISATYSKSYLESRNFLNTYAGTAQIPIFGLYQDYENEVKLIVISAGVSTELSEQIPTAKYEDSRYLNPEKIIARQSEVTLDFNAMMLKNWRTNNSPAIIDTDGELRWIGYRTSIPNQGSIFINNSIIAGTGSKIERLHLDGATELIKDYALDERVTNSGHHNFDLGKSGILIEVDAKNQLNESVTDVESILLEVSSVDGTVIKKFDFAQIISDAIGARSSEFVRPGIDWFHMNAATYWPAENEIVVSSRENFVIAVDYDTAAIKWILGDSTKYWNTFPGLTAHALNLAEGSRAPIGQHAVSITSDGKLMLFDNGFQSLNQPAGENVGENRTYSAPRQYTIDRGTKTATETWNFENDQTLYSPITSSIYQFGSSYLIDYAAEGFLATDKIRLVGIDADKNRAFEYRFPGNWTDGWNAEPLDLSNLRFN